MLLIADDELFRRMRKAVEKVEERMRKTAAALEAAGLPYAVVGGNAVAAWVATRDEAAVRNTRDVDVMIRRGDFEAVRRAMEKEGFIYRHVAGMDIFLDDSSAKALDAVHLLFANEAAVPTGPINPDLTSVKMSGTRFLDLPELVAIKLSVWRRKDQVHLLDMIGVGLIDESWLAKVPASLGSRLKELLDNPNS